MNEEKSVKGTLESYETKTSKTGTVFYKVKVDGKTYSTFDEPKEFVNKEVVVIFKEAPNPQNEAAPYKNIIRGGIRAIGIPQETVIDTEPSAEGKSKPQFIGMCMNQAINLLKDRWKELDNREETYKETVRRLHQWNTDLQKELGE
jgi:hypothetical protein